MKKKACLLLSVMLVCTSSVGCSATDAPQDGQEMTQSTQGGRKEIQIPLDEQDLAEPAQGSQEEVQDQAPQDGQEMEEPTQGEQGEVYPPQDEQEMIDPTQDEQDGTQPPQTQTEESADGNLLYEAFLKNEISVSNPYVEGMNLTVMDDEGYESEFEDAQKKYAYVDVNGDEDPELIFKISCYPSELMYILGICNNELVCFDVFETHTKDIAFGVYDYGFVWQSENYDGFVMTFYSYTADGQPMEARRFTEENMADIAAHEGEEPEWIVWQ